MAISDEMREQLEMVVQYGDQIKAMFQEQDDVDYEIGDYDEPITQLLGFTKLLTEVGNNGSLLTTKEFNEFCARVMRNILIYC